MDTKIRIHQINFASKKEDNLKRIITLLENSNSDLNIFPEYSMGLPENGLTKEFVFENAETINGNFVQSISEISKKKKIAVIFTTFLLEVNNIYNAAIFIEEGSIKGIYKKIHLFDAFGYKESDFFSSGETLSIFNFKEFKVGLTICFDLRFPELYRVMSYKGVNLFITPSAWYEGPNKLSQWKNLITARAHENTCYFLGVNQGNPTFVGHSLLASPLGIITSEFSYNEEIADVNIRFEDIEKARMTVPILKLAKPDLYQKFMLKDLE